MSNIYSTLRWRAVRSRVIARDGARCTVSRLLGGSCSPGPLHVHHVVPLTRGGAQYDLENLATVCSTHHPKWEALRRTLVEKRSPAPRCRHRHRTAEARQICEQRLAQRQSVAA